MRQFLFLTGIALACAAALPAHAEQTETITVTAKLNTARNGIETQLGASTYRITGQDIANAPGGSNLQLDKLVLQAPSVVQDSFGQLHIRGEHNGVPRCSR